MKTDYITSGSTLPPYLAYPRFLLGMNIRLTAKEVGGAEPTAHQRICDALRADTFLTIVQEQTVPTIVVTAAMY